MDLAVSGVSSAALSEYARIPIGFEVQAVLDVGHRSDGRGFLLTERRILTPYLKDYDALGEPPSEWARRFDTSKWAMVVARIGDECVGGATIASDTPGVDIFEGRSDLAVLWDIRVAPARRRQGVGARLFDAAEAWALTRHCRQLKVETQNVNVAACRFYARQGCVLRAARSGQYAESPDEIELLWYKDLAPQAA